MEILKPYLSKKPTVELLLMSILLLVSLCVKAAGVENAKNQAQSQGTKYSPKKKRVNRSKKVSASLRLQNKKNLHSTTRSSLAEAKGQTPSVHAQNGYSEIKLQRVKLISDKEEKSSNPFGLTLIISKSREVEMPESGQYSLNQTGFIFLPSYKMTDNYTLAAKVIAIHDSDDSSKSYFKSGVLKVVKSSFSFSKYIDATPAVVVGLPVNSKQHDDSFQGSLGANINFSLNKDKFDKVSLGLLFGYTKSFYRYKTELNLDPTSDDTYNSDYSTIQYLDFKYFFLKKLSFALTLANKQAWDYASKQKNSYDLMETLNWEINDFFTVFAGLENEEAAKVSEAELIYRFYNNDTSTYIVGFSVSI
ncbi:MAG: hypothetical protein ACXVCY_12370 [Pseudobdellovibrionaceae bacterium]